MSESNQGSFQDAVNAKLEELQAQARESEPKERFVLERRWLGIDPEWSPQERFSTHEAAMKVLAALAEAGLRDKYRVSWTKIDYAP